MFFSLNFIKVSLLVSVVFLSPSRLLINMEKHETYVLWCSHLLLPKLWKKRDQPTAWMSIVYIRNIHWGAGKECWILLLQLQRQCENETHYKSRLKGYKDSERLLSMSIYSRRIFITVCICISTWIKELMRKITLLEQFIIVLAWRLNIIVQSKGTASCWLAHALSLKDPLKSDHRFSNSSQDPSLLFTPAFNHLQLWQTGKQMTHVKSRKLSR